jgi:hypothetical protein
LSDTAKRILLFAAGGIALLLIFLWSEGRTGREFDGIARWQSGKSEFFMNGKCGSSPWWVDTNAEGTAVIQKRWEDLGEPAALRVVFVGEETRLGRWGDGGKYWREVRPKSVIDVAALKSPCQ